MFKIKFREDKNRKTHEEMMRELEFEREREIAKLKEERSSKIEKILTIWTMLLGGMALCAWFYFLFRIADHDVPSIIVIIITAIFVIIFLLYIHIDLFPVRLYGKKFDR